MAIRFFPLFSTHAASCRFCSTVMNVSTKMASCLPEMSVDDIGDHLRSVTPGGKSAVTTRGWVLTNTSQCNEPFILRLRPPHDVQVCVGRTRPHDVRAGIAMGHRQSGGLRIEGPHDHPM